MCVQTGRTGQSPAAMWPGASDGAPRSLGFPGWHGRMALSIRVHTTPLAQGEPSTPRGLLLSLTGLCPPLGTQLPGALNLGDVGTTSRGRSLRFRALGLEGKGARAAGAGHPHFGPNELFTTMMALSS